MLVFAWKLCVLKTELIVETAWLDGKLMEYPIFNAIPCEVAFI